MIRAKFQFIGQINRGFGHENRSDCDIIRVVPTSIIYMI